MLTRTPESLDYTIAHRPRVTRRLHLELGADGRLVVVAPRHWPEKHVRDTLARSIDRVERFILKARERQLKPLEYTDAEKHLYLGQHYPLSINVVGNRKPAVLLKDGQLCVQAPVNNPETVRPMLQRFYRDRAGSIFERRLAYIAGKAPWAGGRSFELNIRKMKRTWGNCSAEGVIKLNIHLIKAPMLIIDAVLAHEVCHLAELNHGKAFYRLLKRLNPEWKEHRAMLRNNGHVYLQS